MLDSGASYGRLQSTSQALDARTPMINRLTNWLTFRISPNKEPKRPNLVQSGAHLRQTGSRISQPKRSTPKQAVPRRQPEFVDLDPHIEGQIEDNGPGKNVFIRNKYVREDTGTHETLKIIDDSVIDTEEEEGIDPYNTGRFDRSRNWDKRLK
jgi:hypothetical protein